MSTVELPPVGPLYGALYFGVIICTAFYGITCMQTFFYHVHYPNDPIRMKCFVMTLWILDTIHEALGIAGIYKYIMAGLMNPYSYIYANPEIIIRVLCTAVVAMPGQGFFVYRIYIFSGKNIIAPVIWVLLATLQFVTAIVYVAKALYTTSNGLQVATLPVLNDKTFSNLAVVTLSVGAGVDILIAIFLTFLLLRKRTTTAFTRSMHILQRLTVFAVNTGIWTALFALFSIILLHVYPTNLIWVVTGMPLCPLYCNTLLANINARTHGGNGQTTNVIDVDLFKAASLGSGSTKPDRQNASGDIASTTFQQGIWKTTEVETFADASRMRRSESACA